MNTRDQGPPTLAELRSVAEKSARDFIDAASAEGAAVAALDQELAGWREWLAAEVRPPTDDGGESLWIAACAVVARYCGLELQAMGADALEVLTTVQRCLGFGWAVWSTHVRESLP